MRCVLGFDGGGTKTDCVLMDETEAILGRSRSGPSNVGNVGLQAASSALVDAGLQALGLAGESAMDIEFILAGISGAGEPDSRSAIQSNLQLAFPKATIAVTSDLVLSLAAAGEAPSVVVIAGTGSAVLGRTSPRNVARAGGFGPIIGDPGSANDIGRKTVALCFQKFLNKQDFLLAAEICRSFACTWTKFVDLVRQEPATIFPKVFPIVVHTAESGDSEACALLSSAAQDLQGLVREVLQQLELGNQSFFLARTGGVFEGSAFLTEQFDQLVRQIAPKARIGPLPRPVAESAAQLARSALTSPLQLPES